MAYVLYKSINPLTVSISSDYSSTINETWTQSKDEEVFSFSKSSETYKDSCETGHGYDYDCCELLLSPSITYNQDATSSTDDNYAIDSNNQNLSVSETRSGCTISQQ